MKATHARLERRDEEVRAIHLERASIEPSCPPPCESFVEAAKERGGRRGYETLRQTVAQAAYGRFDLLFDWLLSHRTPADDEVLADRELGELLAHISEPRRGELLRRLARDIWTRNAPNILTLGRVEYVDAIRRLDAESVAEDAAVRLPPWERLKVIGDNAAELDGTRHRLNGGQAAKMLRLLIDAEGDTVKSSKLGTRPDRVWKKLPEAIQAVVECPDKGRQGYRLR